MKVFLTGATGYLGSAIAAALIRARHDVTALVRSSTSAARVLSYGIHPHHGDLREPASYRDAALAADAIVHAGVEGGADRIDVDRTFVEAVAGPALIYTSVLFVLGNVEDAGESAPAAGPRADHERVVLAHGGAVVRPGMIWGDDAWLFNHPVYIGDGNNRWPLIHRDDVAELYRLVAEQGARGVFHAVAEVRRAREVFPSITGTPLEEARKELGGFADALALDQDVRAPRALALGWSPRHGWISPPQPAA
ncbi:MAG TPA: NAD-dependent epimerase/dehydratase family protein [Thermoanaerobaculia bacterium]|nr:NAD-dependent epimerase/dehydratase family protein [Thermoanaerobaculia bacterium]